DRRGVRSDSSRASQTVDNRDARGGGCLVALPLCRALPRAGGRAAAGLSDSVADAVRCGAARRWEPDAGRYRGTRRLPIPSGVQQGLQATDWRESFILAKARSTVVSDWRPTAEDGELLPDPRIERHVRG